MSVPGKPKPTLFELKTPKTDRMVVSEYNVWRPERTPDHVANVTMTSMERSTGLGKTLHLGTTGPGPERLSAYAHWRVQGDIYSESPSARPPPDRVSSDHKFKPRKLDAHESSPALGYYDRSLYRR